MKDDSGAKKRLFQSGQWVLMTEGSRMTVLTATKSIKNAGNFWRKKQQDVFAKGKQETKWVQKHLRGWCHATTDNADVPYQSAGLSPSCYPSTQLPAPVHLGRRQVMAHVLGSLLPTQGTWTELLAPGFSSAQPWLLWTLESKSVHRRFLSMSPSLSNKNGNKLLKFLKTNICSFRTLTEAFS